MYYPTGLTASPPPKGSITKVRKGEIRGWKDWDYQDYEDFEDDLRPDNLAGEDHGPQSLSREIGLTAYDVKDLHTRLADLTDDELKNIVIVPVGTTLEQGAKYIDLQHLEQGEFVALANMVADEDHYFVPKKETDYVLWNRLNQVTNPVRLDESETPG
jgi:hypothetical protein